MQQKMCASNVLTRCNEECSTSGTTHSSHDVLPYINSSMQSVNSRSGLPTPAHSTIQYPSFAPVFNNHGAVNFSQYLSFWWNQTKLKDTTCLTLKSLGDLLLITSDIFS